MTLHPSPLYLLAGYSAVVATATFGLMLFVLARHLRRLFRVEQLLTDLEARVALVKGFTREAAAAAGEIKAAVAPAPWRPGVDPDRRRWGGDQETI